MNIKILKPLKLNKQPKNKYKFVIELMGGDADAYFYPEVLVDKDNPYLERFLEFLSNCKKEYPNGKGGYDDYKNVKDYYLFVNDDIYLEHENGDEYSEEEYENFIKEKEKVNISFEWEGSYEYFGESSYRDVTITYFNENGIEHKCKINE